MDRRLTCPGGHGLGRHPDAACGQAALVARPQRYSDFAVADSSCRCNDGPLLDRSGGPRPGRPACRGDDLGSEPGGAIDSGSRFSAHGARLPFVWGRVGMLVRNLPAVSAAALGFTLLECRTRRLCTVRVGNRSPRIWTARLVLRACRQENLPEAEYPACEPSTVAYRCAGRGGNDGLS